MKIRDLCACFGIIDSHHSNDVGDLSGSYVDCSLEMKISSEVRPAVLKSAPECHSYISVETLVVWGSLVGRCYFLKLYFK